MTGWNKAPGGNSTKHPKGARVPKKFLYQGNNLTVKEWAKEIGITYVAMKKRVQLVGIEEAIKKGNQQQKFEYNGERRTLYQWAKKLEMSASTLTRRVVEYGWSIKEAIETPIENKYNKWEHVDVLYEYNGKKLRLAQWSDETGLPYRTIKQRLKRGWSIEDTLSRL